MDKDRNSFQIIKDRAAIIKRIYEMALDGIGKRAIARQFNEQGVETFERSKGWHQSYIQKILENEAVIGVYQPHKMEHMDCGKKKRVRDGEPITEYFPTVIEKSTFFKAQKIRRERRIPVGKAGKNISNLFTGLAVCGNCGGTFHFENKGVRPKGGTYLVCSNARLKVGNCKRHAWRYPETQSHIILNLIDHLDFRDVLPELFQKAETAADRIKNEMVTKDGELEALYKKIDNVTEAGGELGMSRALKDKLVKLEADRDNLESGLKSLKVQLEQSRSVPEAYGEIPEALHQYMEIEKSGDDDKVYHARRRLHQLLKSVIDRITLHPANSEEAHLLPDADSLHGNIEITFKGINGDYFWRILVDKGQKLPRALKFLEVKWTLWSPFLMPNGRRREGLLVGRLWNGSCLGKM